MSNTLLAAIYALLAAMSAALFALSLRKKSQSQLDKHFRFVAAMQFFWQIIPVFFLSVSDERTAIYLYDLDLPFVALTALAWLLYIIRFYGLDSYFPGVVKISLFIIPLFTLAMVLTTPLHAFVRADIVITEMSPMRTVSSVRMPWFWFHAAYCYIFLIITFVVAFFQHRKTKTIYRRSSLTLLITNAFTLVGNLMVLNSVVRIDLSLVSLSLASLVLYIITKNTQGLDFFTQARREIYHHIQNGILVADDEGGIVSVNRTALEQLSALGISSDIHTLDDVIQPLEDRAVRRNALHDPGQGMDYYLDSSAVFNVRSRPILDNRQKRLGSITIVSDVTENRQMIDYLDQAAGIDALTGLANRRLSETCLSELDTARNLPLAFIVGDLNNLKTTNDRRGHAQGDIYIRLAAGVLKNTCPPNARIARVGGDEFLIILPGFGAEEASRLVGEIEAAFVSIKDYPFTPSISLGASVKESPEQDTQALLMRADSAMYEQKRLHHAKNT